jgi:hypothetical protein
VPAGRCGTERIANSLLTAVDAPQRCAIRREIIGGSGESRLQRRKIGGELCGGSGVRDLLGRRTELIHCVPRLPGCRLGRGAGGGLRCGAGFIAAAHSTAVDTVRTIATARDEAMGPSFATCPAGSILRGG